MLQSMPNGFAMIVLTITLSAVFVPKEALGISQEDSFEVPSPSLMALKFSRDDSILFAAGGRHLYISSRKNGLSVPKDIKLSSDITSADIDQNGIWAVSAIGNEVDIWEVGNLSLKHKIPHPDIVADVKISRDGLKIATACHDKIARIWDALSGKLLIEYRHEQPVRFVEFGPKNDCLLTCTTIKTIETLAATEPSSLRVLDPEHENVGKVFLWSISDGNVRSQNICDICQGRPGMSSNGELIGVAIANGFRLFDMRTSKLSLEWLGATGRLGMYKICFDGQGSRMLAAGDDGGTIVEASARVFAIQREQKGEGVKLKQLGSFAPNVLLRDAAITADGNLIALGAPANGVWNVATGQKLRSLKLDDKANGPAVFRIAFSHSAEAIAIAYNASATKDVTLVKIVPTNLLSKGK